MTRKEHLEWAKKRALEYYDRKEYMNTITSFMSDLSKHDELRNHARLKLAQEIFMNWKHVSPRNICDWIKGFN